jgi:fibronectin type 3 domain-containing protein
MKKMIIPAILLAVALALGLSACGGSNSSGTVSSAPTADAVSNLAVTSSDQQVSLNWVDNSANNGSSLTSPSNTYNIYSSTNPGVQMTSANRIAQNLNSTSYNHTGLQNGTTYYYIVTAVSPAGVEGAASNEVAATPQAADPAPPNEITIQAGDSYAVLSLPSSEVQNAPAGTTYNIYWSTQSPVTKTSNVITNASFTGTPPSFTHSGLIAGTTYYYCVTAQTAAGESALSNEMSILVQSYEDPNFMVVQPVFNNSSTVSVGLPGSVRGLSAFASNQQVILSWIAPAAPTTYFKSKDGQTSFTSSNTSLRYKVYWQGSNATSNTIYVNGTTFTHTALIDGITYQYYVTAFPYSTAFQYLNQFENPTPTRTQLTVIPSAYTPPSPTNLTAAVASNQEVDLSWNMDTSGGSVTYTIYWWTAATRQNPTKITGLTSTSYTHTGLTPGLTYYYYVTATSQDGKESPTPAEALVAVAL